jgi:hydroxyacylglutathione hydrolase
LNKMTADNEYDSGFREVGADEVKGLLDEGYEIVDVREDWEWERGHVPGARHVVLGQILADPTGHKFADRTVFQCQVGERSAVAAEMAVALGVKDVVNFRGGFGAWKEAGLPVEKP